MKKIIFICLICIFIAGCKDKAPGCSAEETQELVKGIIKEKFDSRSYFKKIGAPANKVELFPELTTINLNAIRTVKENDNGSCLCKAEAVIKYSSNTENSISITYTSELTDKGDEFLVTVHYE